MSSVVDARARTLSRCHQSVDMQCSSRNSWSSPLCHMYGIHSACLAVASPLCLAFDLVNRKDTETPSA
jgi:hypothetical protein